MSIRKVIILTGVVHEANRGNKKENYLKGKLNIVQNNNCSNAIIVLRRDSHLTPVTVFGHFSNAH